MRCARLLLVAILLSLSLVFLEGRSASAAFHCMRIHAVMAGFKGDNNVQYVELRLVGGGQQFVGFRQIKFYDAAGTLKATFTFPNSASNGSKGDSILVATQEFNDATLGGNADFTFSNANTTGSNGGDPLHPVQSPEGRVTFAEGFDNCDAGFTASPGEVDSLTYNDESMGDASAHFGTPASPLPSPSDNRALQLNHNVNSQLAPSANNTEYGLSAVSTNTFSVAASSLSSDLTSPRNNSRTVLQLQPSGPTPTPTSTPTATATPTATPTPTITPTPTPTIDPSVGGVAELPEVAGAPLQATGSSGGNAGLFAGVIAAVVAGAGALGGAAWYVRRRPA